MEGVSDGQNVMVSPSGPHQRRSNSVNHRLPIHIKEPKRTKAQNDRLWPMLHDVSQQVLWHGNRYDEADWKDIFTALWLKTKKQNQRSAPGIDGGVVMFGVCTSKMRKASMTELIEIMFWFGSERNVKWSDDSRRELEFNKRFGDAA